MLYLKSGTKNTSRRIKFGAIRQEPRCITRHCLPFGKWINQDGELSLMSNNQSLCDVMWLVVELKSVDNCWIDVSGHSSNGIVQLLIYVFHEFQELIELVDLLWCSIIRWRFGLQLQGMFAMGRYRHNVCRCGPFSFQILQQYIFLPTCINTMSLEATNRICLYDHGATEVPADFLEEELDSAVEFSNVLFASEPVIEPEMLCWFSSSNKTE